MDVNIINTAKISLDRPRPPAVGGTEDKKQETYDASGSGKSPAVTRAALDKAVEEANEIGQLLHRKLIFSVDEATEKVVVKVVDKESGETVRQVPPREMLRISAHLKKLQEMNEQVMSAVKSVILDFRY